MDTVIPATYGQRSQPALLHAIPVSLFIGGLFYYWFAIADRYLIFLYGHLGATPFDGRTSSRYWMAGLVAAGATLVLYSLANWLLGRLAAIRFRVYTPPPWWQVWLLCAPSLAVAIPAITLTVNRPTLRPSDAAACVAATLPALALALAPGFLAARRPSELGWLTLAGLGLMPGLLLLRALELPAQGLLSLSRAYWLAIGGPVAGATWLAVVVWLHARQGQLGRAVRQIAPGFIQPGPISESAARHPASFDTIKLLGAGLALSYLLLPLAHHLLFTPPAFRYITTSANFFALNESTQLLTFLVAIAMALGFARLGRRWSRRFEPGKA